MVRRLANTEWRFRDRIKFASLQGLALTFVCHHVASGAPDGSPLHGLLPHGYSLASEFSKNGNNQLRCQVLHTMRT